MLSRLKGEYLIVHTKFPPNGGVYPRGYCVYVDEKYIVLEANQEKQLQLSTSEKFSAPFYVVPIDEIRGIAGIDPEELAAITPDVVEETLQPMPGAPAAAPSGDFQDVDFDDQLPESYVNDYLKDQ